MSVVEKIEELIQTTPSYLNHITIQKWLIEQFVKEYKELKKEVEQKNSVIQNFEKRGSL